VCLPPRAASAGLYGVWDGTPRNTGNALDQLALLLSARPVPAETQLPDLHVHERAITPTRNTLLGAAGVNAQDMAFLGLGFVDSASTNTLLLTIALPRDNLHTGEIAFHGFETFGILTELRQSGPFLLGYIGEGSIKLDMAGTETGDVVQGSFSAMLAGHLDP
jgi:hypothetical protein